MSIITEWQVLKRKSPRNCGYITRLCFKTKEGKEREERQRQRLTETERQRGTKEAGMSDLTPLQFYPESKLIMRWP